MSQELLEAFAKEPPWDGLAKTSPMSVYLSQLDSVHSKRTMRNALTLIATMCGHEGEAMPWHRLRYEHTQAIRAALIEHYPSPNSVNVALSGLRRVLRVSWRKELMTADEYQRASDVARARGSRVLRGRAIEAGEMLSMFRSCDPDTTMGARNAALLALLFGGGLRRDEVASAKLEDYEPVTGELRVVGKGNKERIVPLVVGARAALSHWLSVRGDEPGPLLLPCRRDGVLLMRRLSTQGVYVIQKRVAGEADVEKCSPHDFRRTFISELIDKSGDIFAVAGVAGHEHIQTTEIYDRRPEEKKRRVVELLHVPFHGPEPKRAIPA